MGLLDDWTGSNREIALAMRTTPAIVKAARYQLVSLGVIPPSRYTRPPPPRFKELPRAPAELAQGACVGHPHPEWWADPATPEDRAAAKHICRFACHVQEACVEFSLSLPERDTAIWGGTTAADRVRLRAVRAGRPAPVYLTAQRRNAARARRRAAARQQATATATQQEAG